MYVIFIIGIALGYLILFNQKVRCKLGLHRWYYGMFTTGRNSKYTGDPVGLYERHCLKCPKEEIRIIGHYKNYWLDKKDYNTIIENNDKMREVCS